MDFLKKFAFIGLILLFLVPNAQGLTLDELLEKIDRKDTLIADIKFNFLQEIKISLTQEKYQISGSAVYKKPDKLYLKTETTEKAPFPEQTVVLDGQKIWIYTPKYKQVIIEKWSDKGGLNKYGFVPEELFGYVDSVKKLDKNYELEYLGTEDNLYLLLLKAKKKKGIEIKFYISPDTYLPIKTELDAGTVKVVTEIKDIEINTKVEDEYFHFQPPEDVNILSLD